ncbi:MAG: hypothetical protein CMB81_02745 [Flammeovirgaceae bacterium]|mgnify:FL=1|nr:hypothetical protein [Flammeovirgaceae bacterium]
MKIITSLVFILLASSTYRCAEEEITIDCTQATSDMIGTWRGKLSYTNSQANGASHNITLSIISSNGCLFQGISAFDASGTSFTVSGTIDKYGWVEFMETSYEIDGGEYTKCASTSTSSWNNPCNQWPNVRWRTGVKYHEARFRSDPLVLQGEFFSAGGWRSSQVRGTYQIVKD